MRTQTLAPFVAISEAGKRKPKTGLFIDIGSGSVSAALASYGGSGVPEIRYSTSTPIVVRDAGNFDHLLEEALKALDAVLDATLKEGVSATQKPGKAFETVTVSLASPWFVSQTRFVSHAKEKPFAISGSLIKSLVAEAKSATEGQAPRTGTPLEEAIVQTTVNGYATTHPEGKKGVELHLSLYQSFAEQSVLTRITERIERVFAHTKPAFHTFTLTSFHVLRNLYPDQDQLLLLDVAGEVTDVTLVLEDAIASTYTFPVGVSSVIRDVAPAASSPEEAQSLVSVHAEKATAAKEKPQRAGGKTEKETESQTKEGAKQKTAAEPAVAEAAAAEPEPDAQPAVAENVMLAQKKWTEAFLESLKSTCESCPLPRTILLSADAKAVPWFESFIEQADTSVLGPRRHAFKVVPIDAPALQRFIAFSGEHAPFNPFLALAVLFSHIERFE